MIELVVALAVLAIVMAAGVPLLQSVSSSIRARDAAERLLQDVQWAQGQAVQRNMPYILILNGNDCGSSLWSIRSSAGTIVRCMAAGDFHVNYRLVSMSPAMVETLRINSLGMLGALTSPLSLQFAAPAGTAGKTWTVTILPSGRSTIS